ncbi:MAG TPA: hypothetical protein VK654_14610 [Nitrospirota bacterium]|nr:hypothetical protein [Nitrospirota bacterium]
MSRKKTYLVAALLLLAAVAVMPQAALATDAGVTITNTAHVNYAVSGVAQTEVTGSVSFVVDRRVNMTVTNLGNVTSAPSSTFQAIQFLVTNTSNTTMRFQLQAVSKGTNTWTLTTPNIYRDNNSNGLWDAGDTLYVNAGTFGDLATNASVTVLIVGDIPASLPNGAAAAYDLLATAVDAGTLTVTTQTAGAGTMAGVDTVFADAAGSASGDIIYDGRHSAAGTFTITAATIAVAKSAAVYSDPVNNTTNPKAIPGAVVTYTVTITNSAGASASNVTMTDNLNAEITANHIAFRTQFIDGTISCAAGQGSAYSINGGTTWTCQSGTWSGGPANTLTSTIPGTIAAGGSAMIKYQVTVQ